jgi:hypothetical protein
VFQADSEHIRVGIVTDVEALSLFKRKPVEIEKLRRFKAD